MDVKHRCYKYGVIGVWLIAGAMAVAAPAVTRSDASHGESHNLLLNSGFNKQSTPGYPDYWSPETQLPINTPDWAEGNYYGVDQKEPSPAPGAQPLRVRCKGDVWISGFNDSLAPPLPRGVYIASAYLKADRPNMSVTFAPDDGGQKTFEIGQKWQRYDYPFEGAGKGRASLSFNIKIPSRSGEGVVWIAAPQLEPAAVPTPWRPSLADLSNAGKDAANVPRRIPALERPRTTLPPVLDGALDDACWTDAYKTGAFVDNVSGAPVEPKTEALITTDSDNINVAFKCHEPNPRRLDFASKAKGKEIFGGDTVEFFVAPSENGESYFQIAVSPAGGIFGMSKQNGDAWDSGATVKTGPCPEGWTAEMSIPLTSLDASGDKLWRINLCRTRNENGKPVSSCWAGPSGFHNPRNFARISGFDGKRRWDFLSPRLRRTADGLSAFRCVLESPANVGGVFPCALSLSGLPDSGWKSDVKMTASGALLDIGGLPGTPDPDAELSLKITGPATGGSLAEFKRRTLYLTCPLADASSPLRLFAEHSWYPTGTPTAHVKLAWLGNGRTDVTLSLEGQPFMRGLVFDGPGEKTVGIPAAALLAGTYALHASAKVNGQEFADAADTLRILAPKANTTRLNRFTRCFEIDGKPFFPIIFNPPSRPQLADWQYSRLRNCGFNALCATLPPVPPVIGGDRNATAMAILDRCLKNGFKLMAWQDVKYKYRDYRPRSGKDKPTSECFAETAAQAEMFGGHPALLAWFAMDEPTKHHWEGPDGRKESDLKKIRDILNAVDPYHPMTVNQCPGGYLPGQAPYGGYECADFNSFDHYPYTVYTKGLPEPLAEYAKYVKAFNDSMAPLGRATPFWVQTYGCPEGLREPTPDEWQNMVYVSLIHGTRALLYFTQQPASVPLWERMREVHGQIRLLEPVFFSAETTARGGVADDAIHYAVWVAKDKVYVMAANVRRKVAELKLDMNALCQAQLGGVKALSGPLGQLEDGVFKLSLKAEESGLCAFDRKSNKHLQGEK